jgi:hypothetical protein
VIEDAVDDQGRHHLLGRYSNYFVIGHNANEFLMDFGQCETEGKPVQIHTRIATGPFYAKALFDVLKLSIEQYEQQFGPIC